MEKVRDEKPTDSISMPQNPPLSVTSIRSRGCGNESVLRIITGGSAIPAYDVRGFRAAISARMIAMKLLAVEMASSAS